MRSATDPHGCGQCYQQVPADRGGVPCLWCWFGDPDEEFLAEIVAIVASGGPWQATSLLTTVVHPSLVGSLRALTAHESPAVRACAIGSLTWHEDPVDIPRFIAGLRSAHAAERYAGRRALAALRVTAAVDVMWEAMALAESRAERGAFLRTLAYLGDRRVIAPAITAAQEEIASPHYDPSGDGLGRAVETARARLADPATSDDDRRQIRTMFGELGPEPGSAPYISRDEHFGLSALALIGAQEELQPLLAEARRTGYQLRSALDLPRPESNDHVKPALPTPETSFVLEPMCVEATEAEHATAPPPSVPTRAIIGWDSDRRGRPRFATKIGGQPEWREAPAWPVDIDGWPLVFYGQFDLGGTPARTAYLFYGPEGEHWEPRGNANALIVQPGAPLDHLATIPAPTGPALAEFSRRTYFFGVGPVGGADRYAVPVEHWAIEEPGGEPEVWPIGENGWPLTEPYAHRGDEQRLWNKIGGSPLWLQGQDEPEGDCWRFAFQFSADPDVADGAEFYAFIDDDARGAVLWQCH